MRTRRRPPAARVTMVITSSDKRDSASAVAGTGDICTGVNRCNVPRTRAAFTGLTSRATCMGMGILLIAGLVGS